MSDSALAWQVQHTGIGNGWTKADYGWSFKEYAGRPNIKSPD